MKASNGDPVGNAAVVDGLTMHTSKTSAGDTLARLEARETVNRGKRTTLETVVSACVFELLDTLRDLAPWAVRLWADETRGHWTAVVSVKPGAEALPFTLQDMGMFARAIAACLAPSTDAPYTNLYMASDEEARAMRSAGDLVEL